MRFISLLPRPSSPSLVDPSASRRIPDRARRACVAAACASWVRVAGGVCVVTWILLFAGALPGGAFRPMASALSAQEPIDGVAGEDENGRAGKDREKGAVPPEALRSARERQVSPADPRASEGEAAGSDGADPTVAELALASVRELLDSSDSADWVRGLFQLEQALADGKISTDDWKTLLIEYLDPRSSENPERTRAILADRVLRTRAAERVLLELLGGGEAYDRFRRELEETMTRIAIDRERRDELTDSLDQVPGLLFERLFPLLAHHEPGRIVARAVEIYQGNPSGSLAESILRALDSFLGQRFATEGALLEWWAEHQKEPILPLLIEQQRVTANTRTANLWTRANHLIAEGDPVKYRNWLLESLAVTETAEVRRKALQEIERFVARITSGDAAQPLETQIEVMRPILARLPHIISGEATKTLDRDPVATQLLAVRALRSMAIFRDDEDVVGILKLLINKLVEDLSGRGFVSESTEIRIGLAAIKVAGAMRAPVGETLDEALIALLQPNDSGVVAWSKVPGKPLDALLDALKQIGVRAQTMRPLEEVYQNLPGSQVDVLEVLVLRGVPEESESAALQLFAQALAGTGNPEPNQNLQKLAINGFGRLGLPAAIPILEEGIRNAVITGEERTRALQSIRTIGGTDAIASMMSMLAAVPEGDPLREELISLSSELCVADPTLALLESFLIDPATGAARSWFPSVVESPGLASVLDPGKQPGDFQEARPDAFRRFETIQAIRWHARLESALVAPDLAAMEDQLGKISSQIGPLLELLNRFPVGDEPADRELLQSVSLVATHRSRLVEQLALGSTERLFPLLEAALAAEISAFPDGPPEGVPWVGSQVSWLVAQVLKHSPRLDITAFLAGLERLSERYPMGEEVRGQLAELEAKAQAEGTGTPSGEPAGGDPGGIAPGGGNPDDGDGGSDGNGAGRN